MKIVFLADTIDNQNAGIFVYTKNLIKAIQAQDNPEIKLIFIHQKENDFFNGTENYIIPRKHTHGYDTFRRFHLIPKLIRKLKPDVVIEPCHIGPFGLPKDIKRATIIHDLTPILFPKFHIPKSVLVHKLFLKSVIKKADLIITPSQNTKDDIQKYCKTNAQIEVIPEGVDHLKPAQEPEKTLTKFGIKKPFLLFLGTIEPRKNLGILIQAFAELKKEHNIPHQLVFAGGTGWKVKEIFEEAKKHKDIILTDFISENEESALYQECDIFIYPSLYEGFGLPPLEAMSFGKPTIISTGGALKEIPESVALHFPPEDKEKLKLLILKLINDPMAKEALAKNGLVFAKNFTWQKTANKLLTFLDKVVKSSSVQ